MRCLGELDVGIGDDLDAIAPRIQEIEKRPVHHARARGLGEPAHARTVVDHQAKMPAAVPVRLLGLAQRQELVAHIDESLALAAAAQREAEDAAVEGKCLLDVADFKRNVIDADKAGEGGGHGGYSLGEAEVLALASMWSPAVIVAMGELQAEEGAIRRNRAPCSCCTPMYATTSPMWATRTLRGSRRKAEFKPERSSAGSKSRTAVRAARGFSNQHWYVNQIATFCH